MLSAGWAFVVEQGLDPGVEGVGVVGDVVEPGQPLI